MAKARGKAHLLHIAAATATPLSPKVHRPAAAARLLLRRHRLLAAAASSTALLLLMLARVSRQAPGLEGAGAGAALPEGGATARRLLPQGAGRAGQQQQLPPGLLRVDDPEQALRVALLFLTRGPMPFEELWAEFFRTAGQVEPAFVPEYTTPDLAPPAPEARGGGGSRASVARRRRLAAVAAAAAAAAAAAGEGAGAEARAPPRQAGAEGAAEAVAAALAARHEEHLRQQSMLEQQMQGAAAGGAAAAAAGAQAAGLDRAASLLARFEEIRQQLAGRREAGRARAAGQQRGGVAAAATTAAARPASPSAVAGGGVTAAPAPPGALGAAAALRFAGIAMGGARAPPGGWDVGGLEAAQSALSARDAAGLIARQSLFSVYVHTGGSFAYPPGSLFAGYQIPRRVEVAWGQWSVAEAERRLLAAALADPRNQRFVLLSETCAPLHPPQLLYMQLLSERCSRVNACRRGGGALADRWHWGMYRRGELTPRTWRKSSQARSQ
eukprot:scaffold8.g1691.t1